MKRFYILLLLISTFTLSQAQQPVLVSITPDTVALGQTLSATITGANTLFQNSSTIGHLYLGGVTIPMNNISVIDDEHFTGNFQIPSTGIPIGFYDLYVLNFDPFQGLSYDIILPSAVRVGSPDGYITGQVYEDLNNNGVKDATESGIAGSSVKIMPQNHVYTTDANGNYTIAVTNGSYTVSWVNNPNIIFLFSTSSPNHSVTINNNNSSGNDFGVKRGLISVSPTVLVQGQTVTLTIVSDSLFQTSANTYGNIQSASIVKHGTGNHYSANLTTQVQILDEVTAEITLNIPTNALPGLYDLSIQTISPFGGRHILPFSNAISPAQSIVNGKIYFDTNSNGVFDAGDFPIPNQYVTLMPDSITGISDANGDYKIGSSNGSKTLTYVPTVAYTLTSTPATYNFSVNNSIASNKDFGFQTGTPFYEGSLIISGLPRCNTQQPYYVTFRNQSNTAVNGVLGIVCSGNITVASATPDFTVGDTLFWNITNLNLFSTFSKNVVLNIPGAGSIISVTGIIRLTDGSNVVLNHSRTNTQMVLCSFDPNDKAVTPPGVQSQNYTLMNERLYYTVRFQNTGNDTAFTVQIRDLLDPELNWQTFRVEDYSHTVTPTLNMKTGALLFTFNNILLPDSNTNEPASHGYVIYSIEADSGLIAGTMINNTADIYFDLNEPVITNTTLNTMVYVIPVGLNELAPEKSDVIVMPNPASEKVLLKFDNISGSVYNLSVYSMAGKIVHHSKTANGEVLISLDKFNAGLYIYELTPNSSGKAYRGKIVVK
ncbi:MAG: T9SS type A sorting domain-containing protein [Bacteroidetes bacterium]|nr:T9SS type A sorting domain-containing protein [Bacteroidota bacterium]MBX7238695.1 T9SS type A sorting domain-containing protein [Bacteroidia bacterium]MCC7513475.1 T9SS type A sorting domain-containing protein [Bacteroidia bacterium]HMU76406.1 SdrD B-like domain-containing protein [Bacteroidia bacterium]HMW09627.1 SdrD B-like domain-containing protein [Bacteroidia bacterium]